MVHVKQCRSLFSSKQISGHPRTRKSLIAKYLKYVIFCFLRLFQSFVACEASVSLGFSARSRHFSLFGGRENWGERNTEGAGRGRGGEKRKCFSVPPFSSSLLALFCPRPNFRAFKKQRGLQTCEKSYGNACYAGYSWGGGVPYERDGDARRNLRIKTLKEASLGVAQALFVP